MSQQVNSLMPSVQNTAQPQATALAVEPGLPTAQTPTTQLDRIDAMLAAQRAQQAKLGLALKSAKTSTASTDASPAWAMPSLSLGEHTGWFAASGVAVVLLCVGFVVVWKGRFARASAVAQPAAQDSLTDSLLMVSEYNALQPWGLSPAEAAMSQPALSSLAARAPVDNAQHADVDIELDISETGVAVADAATSILDTERESDFVSDEVRKVQQSLAHKRAVRKSQQRALQPEALLETTEPTPEQVLASAFSPLPDPAFDFVPAAAPRAPIIYPAELTDDDAQSTVELQLAQQMADLGQIEDARALCQEVFVKGSEAMQDVALQIMTRLPNLPNVKQP